MPIFLVGAVPVRGPSVHYNINFFECKEPKLIIFLYKTLQNNVCKQRRILFTAQLITVASYNKLSAQTQADISVVAYNKQAYTTAMSQSYNAQANVNVVYNVTKNLSYNIA